MSNREKQLEAALREAQEFVIERMTWEGDERARDVHSQIIEALATPAQESGELKAWRIPKGAPIPQWLEQYHEGGLLADADLLVSEDGKGGYDVRALDPNHEGHLLYGDGVTKIVGGGTGVHLVHPHRLCRMIHELRQRIPQTPEDIELRIRKALENYSIDDGTNATFDALVSDIVSAIAPSPSREGGE